MSSDEFSIEIKGLKEVNAALYAYSQQLGDRVVLASLMQGARVVQRAAKAAAPVRTGRLRRGIVVKKSKIHDGKRSDATIGVYLTLRKGKGKADPRDAFYGRWQELGWNVRGKRREGGTSRSAIVNRFGRRSGRKTLPGKRDIPGKFFLNNAFAAQKANAVQMTIAAANAGAELLAKKVGFQWRKA